MKTDTNLFGKTIYHDLLKMPVIYTQLLLKQDSLHMSKSAFVRFFILTWIVCQQKQHATVVVGHLLLQLQQEAPIQGFKIRK